MVCPGRLLNPIGFQDDMCGILTDLAGAPVEALVDGWYATAGRAVDMIAPKHPLHHRAQPVPWFNQHLWAMKRNRGRLESVWRRNQTENNLKGHV